MSYLSIVKVKDSLARGYRDLIVKDLAVSCE